MVAIYAVIAYNYFVARINGIAMQYRLYCEEFLATLGDRVKPRPAPPSESTGASV
jgi:biopolymer transport protein ExbB/TolQ